MVLQHVIDGAGLYIITSNETKNKSYEQIDTGVQVSLGDLRSRLIYERVPLVSHITDTANVQSKVLRVQTQWTDYGSGLG